MTDQRRCLARAPLDLGDLRGELVEVAREPHLLERLGDRRAYTHVRPQGRGAHVGAAALKERAKVVPDVARAAHAMDHHYRKAHLSASIQLAWRSSKPPSCS